MKVYWKYMCDFGHSKVILKEESLEESFKDAFCDFGHEATMLKKCPPVDEVEIIIQPAGMIVDIIKKQVYPEKQYYFLLKNRVGGDEQKRSNKFYSWEDIRKIVERFHGLNMERAWKLWEELQL